MAAGRSLLLSLSAQPLRHAPPVSLSAAIRLLYTTPVQRVEAVSLLPREGTVGEAWNGPREEKFIPVTRRSLVRWLGEEEGLLSWEEREKLEVFAAALDARFSQRFQGCLKEAKVNTHTHTHTHIHTHYCLLSPANSPLPHHSICMMQWILIKTLWQHCN